MTEGEAQDTLNRLAGVNYCEDCAQCDLDPPDRPVLWTCTSYSQPVESDFVRRAGTQVRVARYCPDKRREVGPLCPEWAPRLTRKGLWGRLWGRK
jgi:hypothetical protein